MRDLPIDVPDDHDFPSTSWGTTIRLDAGDLARGRFAWLAAVEAAPCPPLWARLVRTALDGGWLDLDQKLHWGVVKAAVQLADLVGAPAGRRTSIAPDGADTAVYDTCAGTTIEFHGDDLHPSIQIDSPRAASVVRRAAAVAKALNQTITLDEALVEAAVKEAVASAEFRAASDLREVVHRARTWKNDLW